MPLEKLRAQLLLAFQGALPGQEAQLRMAPQPIDSRRIAEVVPESHRKSGVLLLFYPDASTIYFPLIKRPLYPGTHSGQVALPGGKVEERDPDVVFTALREAEEEIGIDSTKVEVIGSLTEIYIPVSNFLVSPIVGFLDHKPTFVPEKREVARIIPTALNHLIQPEIVKKKPLSLGGGKYLETPYFDIAGEVVWGATAMILSELIQVLKQKGE
ncbi:MAG: CoA pyrophosphatase [Algoriphagus sp.]|nr:CoA pyrophosphatase [Algoriphagus sp.]